MNTDPCMAIKTTSPSICSNARDGQPAVRRYGRVPRANGSRFGEVEEQQPEPDCAESEQEEEQAALAETRLQMVARGRRRRHRRRRRRQKAGVDETRAVDERVARTVRRVVMKVEFCAANRRCCNCKWCPVNNVEDIANATGPRSKGHPGSTCLVMRARSLWL